MPGLFNVANSVAAVAACKLVGVDTPQSKAALERSRGVRGRCEVIYDGEFVVICDYAHTTDALEKILSCVREFAAARIICVFGAAGERDSDKRPSMGAVVAEFADLVVVTSDNPRFEAPQSIIDDVVRGIPADSVPYKTFVDRTAAIEYALSQAANGDLVLLAGKGHEVTQVIGDVEEPFDERAIVNDYMGGRKV
jgi:UDP-N-acetylmuramoyl-L-alanyl-D-glutamate--2,6-diaminopimelate ligase